MQHQQRAVSRVGRAVARAASPVALSLFLLQSACSHSAPVGRKAESTVPGAAFEEVEDAFHGLRFSLPDVAGGWQTNAEGTRLAKDVRVEVGSFPLAHPGTVANCRDTARERLRAMQRAAEADDARAAKAAPPEPSKSAPIDPVRDQTTSEEPSPSWSFTRGADLSAVRSRWAFFVRGADCLLIEVTGPLGSQTAEAVFQQAAASAHTVPVPVERQRELDVLAGMGFLQQHDPASALERFETLCAREPSFALGHYGALMAAFELGAPAYPRGLAHGSAALAQEHDLSADQRQLALSAIGVMQLAQNQLKQAAQTLSELVVRAPELADGQYNYACALARLGDAGGALDHLKSAFSLDTALAEHARDDDDLASLRGLPAFESLLHGNPAKH